LFLWVAKCDLFNLRAVLAILATVPYTLVRPETTMKGIDLSGERDASGFSFAIVVTRWNEAFTSRLLDGALDALKESGATEDAVEVFKVPGAFELPLACLKAGESGRFDAVIALGLVLRGETPHFDFVAGEAARGITDASLKSGVPVLFGVITADTEQQAEDRCGTKSGNKGYEAAIAAVEIADLYRRMNLEQGVKGKEKEFSHGV
jgi:6,7-dimethyl-8-ribityllumazine synthase